MSPSFSLVDPRDAGQIHSYLSQACDAEHASVRVIGGTGALAVYTAVLQPSGQRDDTPTVLGLRTFAIAAGESFDAVVPVRSLLARLERAAERAGSLATAVGSQTITLPLQVSTVTWSQITLPSGRWHRVGMATPALLSHAARDGLAELAAATLGPARRWSGTQLRSEVWGRPIPGLEYVPAGVALAAHTLALLDGTEPMPVLETGRWTRLSPRRGHVLFRRASWSLRR